MKESTKEVHKNAVVCTNYQCKEKVVGHVQHNIFTYPCFYPFLIAVRTSLQSSDLDGDDYGILNILKEMLEGSKESESVISEFKKRAEVMKDPTPVLTTIENRLCGYFLFGGHFQL